jgi:demethylmenaquinone methyltransferase / 2-methoxy-6-polyprenyl-1,4-benzoquinol methylase
MTLAPDAVRTMFDRIAPVYDVMNRIMTAGLDVRWRRLAAESVVRPGDRVLDAACGTGDLALADLRAGAGRVTGLDFSEKMLERARRKAPLDWVQGDVLALPFADATFDAVTFSYLLRYVDDPAATIAEMARCLRPGGTMASLEFSVPPQPVWHGAWWCYTRLALPVLGAITGGRAWYQVGRFLGPSISAHYRRYPIDAHVAAWRAAGLTGVGVELMSLGGGLIMWGSKS